MKKLDKICIVLMGFGLGIIIFNGVFLDNNMTVGLIGFIMFFLFYSYKYLHKGQKEKSEQ